MSRREFKVKWIDVDATSKPQEKRQAHIMAMLREQLDAGGFKLSHTDADGASVYYAEEPSK